MKKTRYTVFVKCSDAKKAVGHFDDLDTAKNFADKKASKEPIGSGCWYIVQDNCANDINKEVYKKH